MSIRVMANVWEMDGLSPHERLVLLCLADHANDSGECYPSMTRLCARTGMTDRGVQKCLGNLVERRVLDVERGGGRGKSNRYTIAQNPEPETVNEKKPRTRNTEYGTVNPERDAVNPEPGSPEPYRTVIEPSVSKKETPASVLCQWAGEDAVSSFITYRRKMKGAALTLTAAKRLANHLKTIFDSGGDPDDALGLAEEKGWKSVEASWYFNAKGAANGNGNRQTQQRDERYWNIINAAAIGSTERNSH